MMVTMKNIAETRLKKSREEEKMMITMIVNDINDNIKRGSVIKMSDNNKEILLLENNNNINNENKRLMQ